MKLIYESSKIYYTSQGTGRPLVLLHGFLASSSIWEPFVNKWCKFRQVICIDLPGHGQSDVMRDVSTMELLAEIVHMVVMELGLSKVDLLGHSMGGYVGLAYLEQHPKAVGKIILLNSSPAADSEERKKTRERAAVLVKRNKPAFVSMAIKNLVSTGNYQKFNTFLKNMKNQALEFPAEGLIAALDGMKIRTCKMEALKKFPGEKYFIVGKYDSILPVEELRIQSTEAGARLYELPGGHLSFLENKDEFEKIVQLVD